MLVRGVFQSCLNWLHRFGLAPGRNLVILPPPYLWQILNISFRQQLYWILWEFSNYMDSCIIGSYSYKILTSKCIACINIPNTCSRFPEYFIEHILYPCLVFMILLVIFLKSFAASVWSILMKCLICTMGLIQITFKETNFKWYFIDYLISTEYCGSLFSSILIFNYADSVHYLREGRGS